LFLLWSYSTPSTFWSSLWCCSRLRNLCCLRLALGFWCLYLLSLRCLCLISFRFLWCLRIALIFWCLCLLSLRCFYFLLNFLLFVSLLCDCLFITIFFLLFDYCFLLSRIFSLHIITIFILFLKIFINLIASALLWRFIISKSDKRTKLQWYTSLLCRKIKFIMRRTRKLLTFNLHYLCGFYKNGFYQIFWKLIIIWLFIYNKSFK
jgi:hypothetical protein